MSMLRPAEDAVVPVFFSTADRPEFDGDFSEWAGLDGPLTRLAVYGGSHVPEDAEAFFVLRTDGVNLFVYCRVTDDIAHENFLPGSMAWRSDTPEIFFGTTTSKHRKYTAGDNQIRLVPRSKDDIMAVDIVINQRTVDAYMVDGQEGTIFQAAAVYFDGGYEIEASIPLSLMMIDELKVGQKVRCDFQVNDADETERDRMVHWMSDKDTPWFDPSVWGNGAVAELPEIRKETPDVL
ncbi:MAG: sugar-binding protein [Spirochaetaceae bacterium]|nr:sugar-binding protein [Spirochaetaceae bacterium]MDT8297353.1 sugar-binding protein [Spirochaetaceae bacterium]